jgi:ubiquinone/menaquinone biosynthesis C-methylase UbiE
MSSSTESSESFQIPIEAAEFYEEAFVPAFFAQWAIGLCAAVGLTSGQRVLDVACGTGIVARTAAGIVGAGNVTGTDLNEAMLTVARRVRGDIDWHQADVTSLPFPDDTFDVVLCQMALMFFPDRAAALAEMRRVCAPGGTVAVLVPSELAVQAAYGPLVDVAAEHAGPEARSLLGTYFSCGDGAQLRQMFETARLDVVTIRTEEGAARFPSVDALLDTEVKSTPLGERITDDVYARIRAGAIDVLARFTAGDGTLDAPFECTLVVGRHP